MSMTAGMKLGRYEIGSQIDAGGMGEVYRASDPKIGRDATPGTGGTGVRPAIVQFATTNPPFTSEPTSEIAKLQA